MNGSRVGSGRWPAPARARVRVRFGRYVVVGRVARIAPRAAGPPPALRWGAVVAHGRAGYGAVSTDGTLKYWRPLPELD